MIRTAYILYFATFLIALIAGAIIAKDFVVVRGGHIVFVKNIKAQPYLIIEGYAGAIWLGVIFLGSLLFHDVWKSQFDDRLRLEKERYDLSEAEDDVIKDGSIDFIKLWKVTQRRIDLYHKIATQQSQRSFTYGQWAAGIGFVIIIISGIIALFARSAAAAVAAAITGVAGGGLGAYIGATFMRSQDVTSAQLRDYFRQPLELSRYLAGERLLSSLDENDRTLVIQKLIEAIVSSHDPTK